MNVATQYPIIKYNNGIEKEILDKVVVEYNLNIFVNEQLYKKTICSPDSLEELVIGELITEDIIKSMDDLKELVIDEGHCLAKLVVKDKSKQIKKTRQLLSEKILPQKEKILSLFQLFVSSSDLFKSTGGVHSCAMVNDGGILYQQDDISRQNAVNKVIGFCYKNNMSVEDKLLFTSCRISSEIMMKVIHSGIKVIISKSAPTDVAIELAKKNGMILFGFVRGNGMNRYC